MPKRRDLLAVLVVGLMCLQISPVAAQAARSPEEAIAAYVEGIAQQDFRLVLAATAVDEMAKHFDFVAYVDRLQSLAPFMSAPAGNSFYVSINHAALTAQIGRQVQFLAYGLLTQSEVTLGKTVRMDAAGAELFAAEVDPRRLAGLTLLRVGVPNPTIVNTDRYRENAARIARGQGADDHSERIALIMLEGRYAMIGFSLLRYGDVWAISSQTSPIAGTDTIGTPSPITPELFEEALQ